MFDFTTRSDGVRVTGLLMGSVTGSTELVILDFCAGIGGVSDLSSWLVFLLVEESAISVELVSCATHD